MPKVKDLQPKKDSKTYECSQCGTRFIVSESGEGHLSPVFCCGKETKKKRNLQGKKKSAAKIAK